MVRGYCLLRFTFAYFICLGGYQVNKFDTAINKQITRLFCKGQVGGKQFRYEFLNSSYTGINKAAARKSEKMKKYLWEEKDRRQPQLLRALSVYDC